MQNNLKQGDKVYFTNDTLPYEVKVVSERYVVCVRALDKKGDRGLMEHDVRMGGYFSIEEAYNHQKDNPVYTLLDFTELIRSPNNLVFSDYDYWKQEDCEKCIADLIAGEVELSQRNKCDLMIDRVIPNGCTEIVWAKSSNIKSAFYNPETKRLNVIFKNGGTYQYADVPEEIWSQLIEADSPGSFLAKEIKDKFQSVKL